ncbi:MAG TPA: DUF1501 domain-containing protein [Isosphaeraceae bacterium]|jgi:hypothetical protein|nr:DUF1501 domain-containing protein [Isosphaeraceae bacterium]
MLRITAGERHLCDGLSRREVLRVGAASLFGLALPNLLRAASDKGKPQAKSVILFFLEGGPAHQDLWDMKPDAPEEIRGEFKPIDTTVPGLLFCEHLPMLARQAHHLTLVRSVHHTIADHNAGAYFALTGYDPVVSGRLITTPSPDNFPPFGAVLAKLQPAGLPLPDFVHTPDWMSNNGSFLPGQDAGFLGTQFDPFITGDPSLPHYKVPGLDLPRELSLDRVSRRRSLLDAIDHTLGEGEAVEGLDIHYRKAYSLIASPEARRAFDLSQEPQSVRERYGLDPDNPRTKEARQFGGLPHLGQCLLLTRRLIEAGVRLVTVCTGARYDQSWDTHRQHFPLLKRSLLPMFDRGFSALLEDLHQRGLLDETLVVAMGEFGRTPKVGQITSSAGADKGGRDHWPHCYTALFAGAGMPKGAIYGASDADAAHPARDPVTPQDIAATIYQILGIPPDTQIRDPRQNRPYYLSTGTPIPLGG